MTNSPSPRTRRRALLPAGAVFGVLLGAVIMLPRHGHAAEDEMDAQIRNTERSDAPPLDGAAAWINMDKPLSIAQLKGKVVLLDFWTFG